MAFADLSPTQAVSFTDAQSGGFALKSGQSHVTSNQCMTRNDALTKYVLNVTNMNSFSDNQLVPKNNWASGVVGNAISVYLANPSTDATCSSHAYGLTVYSTSTSISNGVVLYSDASMSSIYSTRLTHYDAVGNRLFSIDASGTVNILTACIVSYQWGGLRGSLSCLNGKVSLANPVSVTVFSANPTLTTGVYLYNDAELTSPYTRGNAIRVDNRIYSISSNGMINSFDDVGNPC